jgi:hypothetical protein
MLFSSVTALVAILLAQTPFLWPHTAASAVITGLAALAAGVFSVMGIVDRRYRTGVAVAGAVLALSAFVIGDGIFTAAVQLASGLFLYTAGIAPQVRRVVPAAAPAVQEPLRRAA